MQKKPKVQGKTAQVPAPKLPISVGHQIGLARRAHLDERPARSAAFEFSPAQRHFQLSKSPAFRGGKVS